eukprot:TRINITY_DN5978_c0_g1_i1.p1 TRINITY_DN5978_c0_g1~~TRINITY_DN5978_c0_g1_i1.p1  ORF type:complete len:381 (-),score=68.52 TRINITY_DN5978_c0_g1_i1:301-1443(-)
MSLSSADTCVQAVVSDATFTTYRGFVTCDGEEHRFLVTMPPQQQKGGHMCGLAGAKMGCSFRLKEYLKGYEDTVEGFLRTSIDISAFILELNELIDRISIGRPPRSAALALPPLDYYSRLLAEVEVVGWDKVLGVDHTLSTIQLGLVDAGGRSHLVTIKLPPSYPHKAPESFSSFPRPVSLSWVDSMTLRDVVAAHETVMEKYQSFWNEMDDIDKHTCVIEPEHPTRDGVMRRIALGPHCSLQFKVVDPLSPTTFPECHFLGADSIVNPIRDTAAQNMYRWDASHKSLRQNLQTLLAIDPFPPPSLKTSDDYSMDCNVCYAYRLNGSVPDVVCEYSKCARPYHRSCLYEWLRSLPGSRQSFNTIFGTCPYCSQPITVKVA